MIGLLLISMRIHIAHLLLAAHVGCQYHALTASITVAAISRTIRRIAHATSQAILISSGFVRDISNSVARVSANTYISKLEN